MSLLMPRMQYGGKASASVAVTGAAGLLPTEAEDQEKLVVTGEFGGGGYIAAERHALILRGVQNCLRHLGALGRRSHNALGARRAGDCDPVRG